MKEAIDIALFAALMVLLLVGYTITPYEPSIYNEVFYQPSHTD
jgi:hypothetical protein